MGVVEVTPHLEVFLGCPKEGRYSEADLKADAPGPREGVAFTLRFWEQEHQKDRHAL